MMKFKYIGALEAVNLNINKKLQPGEVIDVPEDLVERFDGDRWYERIEKSEKPVKVPTKAAKGDK